MLEIKINGKALRSYPITQDENGPYHRNLTSLVQMGGGKQYALDFGNMRAGYKVTANQDCKVITKNSNLSGYIAVDFGTYQVCFVHVYKQGSGNIRAGQTICEIAPSKYNGGYAVHLHVYGKKNRKDYKIRNVIFAKLKPKYNVGDWVELTSDTNLRKEPAGHKGAIGKKGDKFKIVSTPVEKAMAGKTYTWYQGVNTKLQTYWFFDGNLKKSNKPDTFDAEKYLQQIRKLEAELKQLSDNLDVIKESNEELIKENEKLQNDKLSAIDMYKKVKNKLDIAQKALEGTQGELKDCKQGCDKRVAEAKKQRLSTLLRERPVTEQITIVFKNLLTKLTNTDN